MKDLNQLYTEAPILKQVSDLYVEFYLCLKLFPKKDQYLLGRQCEQHILDFMRLIISAVSLPRDRKLLMVEDANSRLDVLKILFRMAREFKMLDNKKYLSLESRIQLIGRMIGGWMRSLA